MHMRKKKNRDTRLERVKGYFAKTTEEGAVLLDETFANPGELYLEIGCGKGAFITELSRRVEGKRLLAVELITDALLMAMEKCAAEDCKNLMFLNANAEKIHEILPPHSVSRLYLNFSDPWPKERHAKRRLTYRAYLLKYFKLLKPGGKLRFKTDNVGLFDFTLSELEALALTPDVVTRDLHDSAYAEGNVMTEYEKNFSSQGYPIHMLVLTRPDEETLLRLNEVFTEKSEKSEQSERKE